MDPRNADGPAPPEPSSPVRLPSGKKGKKRRSREEQQEEKLPYVHVRARRGQATDSHSLAERARREKINARMKLLRELVPGCSKISGTALVLEEIINHVQFLQRQVEFLSMRLAAVNTGIDFASTNSFLPDQDVRIANGGHHPSNNIWPLHMATSQQTPSLWEREGQQCHPHGFVMRHESHDPASPVSIKANQLKMEL